MTRNLDQVSGLVMGLHHITLVTTNQEVNRRFCTEILGLKRVKLTVNQDDPLHRHLFYADDKGTTGSAITFFEWPELPRGRIGLGSPHHLAYSVPEPSALGKWKAWLTTNGVPSSGPYAREGRVSLYLRDPDGVVVELTSPSKNAGSESVLSDSVPDVHRIESDMKLTTFNHASPITSDQQLTGKFLNKFVGIEKTYSKPNPDQLGADIVSFGNQEKPDFLRYLSYPSIQDGVVGRGNIHHVALAVEEDEDQLKIMRRMNEVGMDNSGIVDRFWFKSLYFRDPDGNLLEIATKRPGYTADEKPEQLGTSLVLPAWLEPKRQTIETYLKETDRKNSSNWPPSDYPKIECPPESLVQI
ncbi:MAG TPA: VOC family protein [Nitrososphaerales archaeon]|nr:VOC family protein [Nitrososphaerales archaeon]